MILISFQRILTALETVVRQYGERMPGQERRLEAMAKASYALTELPKGTLDRPLLVLYLRDFLSYVIFEFYPKWWRKAPPLMDLIIEATKTLNSFGVKVEQQPDWREEAWKLYRQLKDGTNEPLNPVAEVYLERWWSDGTET